MGKDILRTFNLNEKKKDTSAVVLTDSSNEKLSSSSVHQVLNAAFISRDWTLLSRWHRSGHEAIREEGTFR